MSTTNIGKLQFTGVTATTVGKGGEMVLTLKKGITVHAKPGATSYSLQYKGVWYDEVTKHNFTADGVNLEVYGKPRIPASGKVIQVVTPAVKPEDMVYKGKETIVVYRPGVGMIPVSMAGRKGGYGCNFKYGGKIHKDSSTKCKENQAAPGTHANLEAIVKTLGRELFVTDFCENCAIGTFDNQKTKQD
jgi:hypothetical protein